MNKKERVLQELLKFSSQPSQSIEWMIDNLGKEWKFIKVNPVIKKSTCICGNDKIKTEFIIQNKNTKKELILGSTCIVDINFVNAKELQSISTSLLKLKNQNDKYIENWKEFFNRKLLMFLYASGYFDNESTPKYNWN